MSSRLVILPKKSWNVWNRENVEKVRRDERLAAEEAAATEKRAREIEQERRVEELKRRAGSSKKGRKDRQEEGGGGSAGGGSSAGGADGQAGSSGSCGDGGKGKGKKRKATGGPAGEGQGWGGSSSAHVNFFEEAELANKASGTNPEHEREKREKELREQRQSGLAPTALGGDDPGELPWWCDPGKVADSSRKVQRRTFSADVPPGGEVTYVVHVRGRKLVGQEADKALERDAERKLRADPMARIVANDGLAAAAAAAATSAAVAAALPLAYASRRGHSSGVSSQQSVQNGGKAAEKDRSSGSRKGREASPSIEELRRRRLEREKVERSRVAHLLARQEPWSPAPDEKTLHFNSQYNPQRARQNR